MGILKPDIAIFHMMLEKLHVPADQAVFIDDNELNIQAAKSIHLHGIWYQDLSSLKRELRHLKIHIAD